MTIAVRLPSIPFISPSYIVNQVVHRPAVHHKTTQYPSAAESVTGAEPPDQLDSSGLAFGWLTYYVGKELINK